MMHCQRCDVDVHPIQEHDPSGILDACPKCASVFGKHDHESAPSSAPTVIKRRRKAKTVDIAAPLARTAPASQNVLSMAKARLTEVERQLGEYRDLEDEAAQLRRMIAAAEDTTH